MKKIISVLLTLVILLTTFAFTTVESVASDGIMERITALRSKFPHGKYWNHYTNANHNHNGAYGSCTNGSCNNPNGYTSSPCSSHQTTVGVGGIDCNNFDGAIQCMGYAYKLFYDIFGVYASQTINRYDTSNVAVGDYVRILGDTHSALVIGRSGDTITVAECNLDGSGPSYNCYIRWDKTYSVSSINYFKHASNYDVIKGSGGHTCDYGTFLYFWAAHPHYNCYKCSICGQETVDRNSSNYWDKCSECTNPHTHSYSTQITKTPTCVEEGITTYVCSCGDWYTKAVSALGHTAGAWSKIKEPSYIEKGVEVQNCTVCGEQVNKRSIPMLTYVNKFTDVKDNAWYADEVAYVVKYGYMNGMSETKFSPNSNITREQFVMILANYSKASLPNYVGETGFSDVPEGRWYSNAIQWARKKGYTDGVGNGKFGLGQEVTREQIAKFLYNYAEIKGRDVTGRADITEYTDDTKVSSWALDSVKWAVYNGIITSTRNDSLVISPRSTTTRAQAARMFMIFDETK